MDENQNIEPTASEQANAAQPSFGEAASPTHIKQQTTEKQNLATGNKENQNTNHNPPMEVHHPHHPSHKKKWSEYLLEFFMLFLAVFLGFVAENIRETYIERHREKEYIIGMVQNLKDDTTLLNRVTRTLTLSTGKMDSLVHLSKADFTVPGNREALWRIAIEYAGLYSMFKTNNAAITQLKQSGNLRLIRKGFVADSILKYDYFNTRAETQWQQYHLMYNDYLAISEEVFDLTMVLDTSYFKNGKFLDKLPPPVTPDIEKLKLYFNKLAVHLISSRGYLRLLNTQSDYASQLIVFLKNEYHLEDE